MKTYMVLLKVGGDKDSEYEVCRADAYWWRCKKASSPIVAAKRAIAGVLEQFSDQSKEHISAVWVETVTKQKANFVLQAYFDAHYYYSGVSAHDIGQMCEMLSTIRWNAPELLGLHAKERG